MSSTIKLTVTTAFAHFPFIPDVGFLCQEAGERPCYHCVVSLHQDARLFCAVEEASMSCCLVCADAHEPCCAIPEELLGAAQKIWNGYIDSLRNQLLLIGTCHDTPAPDEEPTSNRDKFRTMLKPDLVALLKSASGSKASAPWVTDRTSASATTAGTAGGQDKDSDEDVDGE